MDAEMPGEGGHDGEAGNAAGRGYGAVRVDPLGQFAGDGDDVVLVDVEKLEHRFGEHDLEGGKGGGGACVRACEWWALCALRNGAGHGLAGGARHTPPDGC